MSDQEKRFSLALELSMLSRAFEAVRALVDDGLVNPELGQQNMVRTAAILNVASARLDLVCAALRGEIDARWVLAGYNETRSSEEAAPDIRLIPRRRGGHREDGSA